MTENRAELILALRDEISKGLAPVNAALAQTKQQITDLGGGSKTASANMAGLAESGTGVGNALAMAHGHASMLVGRMAALLGVTVSVAGGLALVEKGLGAIEQFNLGAIATSALMLSRANIEGISEQQTAYGQYKAYVLNMYAALGEETVRHFATGKEMIGTFNAFARQGIYASKEEANAVGVVTDAVRLLHGGLTDEQTALHEIRGVLEGHAGIHYRLAQVLAGQIGPEWKEIVQSHIKDGTLLQFMQEQFKGLSVASGDIQKTITAQSTTLYTILGQVGRGGLGGLYEDVVGSVSNINDYLREHKDTLIVGIAQGWATVKWTVGETKDLLSGMAADTSKILDATANKIQPAPGMKEYFLDPATFKEIENIVDGIYVTFTKPILWVTDTGNSLKIFTTLVDVVTGLGKTFDTAVTWYIDPSTSALKEAKGIVDSLSEIFSHPVTWIINTVFSGVPGGTSHPAALIGYGSEGDSYGDYVTRPDTSLAAAQKAARLRATKQFEIMTSQGLIELPESITEPSVKTPPWAPPQGAGAKGGGGKDTSDSTLASLQQKIDGLLQDIGKINDGAIAGVDAWAQKSIDDINKVAAKNANSIEVQKAVGVAEGLVAEDAAAKKDKIAQDFSLKMYKMAGDTTTELEIQYNEDLKNATRITGGKELLDQAYAIKRWQVQEQANEKIEGLYKTELSAIAGAVPLLSQQLPIQNQLLNVEIERNRIKMEEQILLLQNDHRLTESQANEIRGLQAVAAQEQRNAQKRKEWMTQGVSGGLQAYAADRAKEAETREAQWAIDAMKGAEQWLGQTGGQALVDYLHGKKADLSKLFSDLGDSAVKQIWTMGVTKGFDFLGKTIGGAFGVGGKPTGSMTNPFYVVQVQGIGGNIGGSISKVFGEGADELDQSSQDLMKVLDQGSLALEDDAIDFGATFSSSSEVFANMFTFSAEGLSSVCNEYGSMFDEAASGLIDALGSGGGGGGGGGIFGAIIGGVADFVGSLFHTGGIVMHDGGAVYAHDGWPPLKHDERRIIGQVGEGILSQEDMSYLGGPAGFDAFRRSLRRGGASSSPAPAPAPVTQNTQHHTLTLVLATPEGRTLGRHQLNFVMDETQKRIDHGEIRIPATGIKRH